MRIIINIRLRYAESFHSFGASLFIPLFSVSSSLTLIAPVLAIQLIAFEGNGMMYGL